MAQVKLYILIISSQLFNVMALYLYLKNVKSKQKPQTKENESKIYRIMMEENNIVARNKFQYGDETYSTRDFRLQLITRPVTCASGIYNEIGAHYYLDIQCLLLILVLKCAYNLILSFPIDFKLCLTRMFTSRNRSL